MNVKRFYCRQKYPGCKQDAALHIHSHALWLNEQAWGKGSTISAVKYKAMLLYWVFIVDILLGGDIE